jgi:imidazoleglycerol-phosphate dehydratase
MAKRVSTITRNTKETQIQLNLNLDGSGNSSIETGIGFFNHMLEAFTKHGFFDLTLKVQGDLQVDSHHTIEDTGIVLGSAIKEAISDKEGIKRYGNFILPMDDALVLCAIDLCGRPYHSFDYSFEKDNIGYLDTEMIREFFYAISYSAEMNLHIKVLSGNNTHHIIEAMFKTFAKALDDATIIDKRINGVLSTKGTL